MKIYHLIISIAVFVIISSCGRNKMKSNEQSLSKQILTEEEQLAREASQKAEHEKQLADSVAKLPKGFRFKEDRKIDPNNPPEIIDIAGNLENKKEFKLSDVVSSIRYIRLQQTNDSTFWGELTNDIQLTTQDTPSKQEIPLNIIKNKDYIVAYNHLGMLLYNSKGELLRTICSNEFTGFGVYKSGIASRSGSTFKGANGKPQLVGNKLFYNYEDDVNKISRMMEVDCNNLPISLPANNENLKQITGLGEPVAFTGERSYNAAVLSPNSFLKVGLPKLQEDMLTIYSNNGDTICSIPGNQKIVNYTKTVARTPDFGSRFTFRGNYYFREAHSDTIFKVFPPNRLIPAFIINLGKYKVEKMQQGMDPDFDLSNKFLLKTIAITDNFVFIYYTKGYDSTNARKEKTVKFFHAIYNRKNRNLWHVESDPDNYQFALENDLDGGLPVWPGSFSFKYFIPTFVSENGEIVQSIKGEILKEYIASEEFKNSSAPAVRKQKLVVLAKTVSKYETIVVIMN